MASPKMRSQVFFILGLLGLFVLFLLPAINYGQLPETIPTHFNASGQADDWGSRKMIWLLPCIGLVTSIMLIAIGRSGVSFVSGTPFKEGTEEKVATYLQSSMLMTNAVITWMFVYICWKTIQLALGQGNASLGTGFLWIVISLTVAPSIWYVFAVRKFKK